MTLYQRSCKNCGGNLVELDGGRFKCEYCGSVFTCESVEKHMEELHRLFDESKREAIANARKNLYDAVNAEYISSTLVHECAMAVKQLIPDDFQANFYEIAIGNNPKKIAKLIRKLDISENASAIDSMVRFLILSLQSEFVTEVGDLIERAYKGSDLTKYEKYSTELSVEAERIDNCIYMTSYPRDVFVAYSSKDMGKVLELVECLEEQGFSCFIAARNLRHGRGAVENYDKALREAMDNCTSFVFVSSMNSRHPGCDALKREIPYIKSTDIENSPAEFRQDYAGIPHKYKKHRVEYRIEESSRPAAADKIVGEFFAGYERVYSAEEVADRIFNRPVVFDEEADTPTAEQISTKFCIACLAECEDGAEMCPVCGNTKFASTHMEAELMKELVDSRKRTTVSEVPAAGGAPSANVGSLLKRAFMFLEDGKWNEANEYCEKALDIDPENPDAYLGKLMVELEVKSKNALGLCEKSFCDNNNYKKVIRFGNEEIKSELAGYIKQINDRIEDNNRRIEEARIEELYQKAVQSMEAAKTEKEYKNAALIFSKIKGYKNSAELIERCLEQGQLRYDLEKKTKKRKKVKILTIVTSLIVAILLIVFVAIPHIALINGDYYIYVKMYGVNEFKVPDGVTKIKAEAFSGCTSLTSIAISDSVESIGASAFDGCTSLSWVDIPNSVISIEYSAFKNCSNLSSIAIPDSVKYIGSNAFEGCSKLTNITIPNSVISIGDYAFKGCTSLTSIAIPNSVTSIDFGTFKTCLCLTNITIPNSVVSISRAAFDGCRDLETVYYTGTKKEWGEIKKSLLENSALWDANIIYNYVPEE